MVNAVFAPLRQSKLIGAEVPTLDSVPPLVPHSLFDRLALGGVEAAATISRAECVVPRNPR
jgi:hypothetical protein